MNLCSGHVIVLLQKYMLASRLPVFCSEGALWWQLSMRSDKDDRVQELPCANWHYFFRCTCKCCSCCTQLFHSFVKAVASWAVWQMQATFYERMWLRFPCWHWEANFRTQGSRRLQHPGQPGNEPHSKVSAVSDEARTKAEEERIRKCEASFSQACVRACVYVWNWSESVSVAVHFFLIYSNLRLKFNTKLQYYRQLLHAAKKLKCQWIPVISIEL